MLDKNPMSTLKSAGGLQTEPLGCCFKCNFYYIARFKVEGLNLLTKEQMLVGNENANQA